MRPLLSLLLSLLSLLSVVCGVQCSSSSSSASPSTSSTSSSGAAVSVAGSVVVTAVSASAFPPRSRASCAVDLTELPTNASAAVYVLGGYNSATVTLYNDVRRSTAFSFSTTPPVFTSVSQSSSSPYPYSSGGGAAVLLNGALLQFGGEGGVASNDVFTSQDGGASWYLVTLNAPWASRTLFASCSLPSTDIVVVAGGELSTNAPSPPFNSSDVWITQDGLGLEWSQVNANAPFGSVLSAAAVGLYDHSIVLCGGQRNGSYLNECWLSQDIGTSWSLQQPTAPWSARSAHSLTVDADDLIYLIGGSSSTTTAASPLEVWVSNTKGSSWFALQLSTASSSLSLPSSVLYGCSFIRQQSAGVRQLVVYSGEDASGAPIGLIAANLTVVSLSPASSTGIPLTSSAGATTKPALPSSTAAAVVSSTRGGGGSSTTSISGISSSSSSTGNTQTNGGTQQSAASVVSWLLTLALVLGCM